MGAREGGKEGRKEGGLVVTETKQPLARSSYAKAVCVQVNRQPKAREGRSTDVKSSLKAVWGTAPDMRASGRVSNRPAHIRTKVGPAPYLLVDVRTKALHVLAVLVVVVVIEPVGAVQPAWVPEPRTEVVRTSAPRTSFPVAPLHFHVRLTRQAHAPQ